MSNNHLTVKVTAEKLYKRKVHMRIAWTGLAVLLLIVSVIYGMIYMANQTGNFTINLDPNLKANKSIVISSTSDFKKTPLTLKTNALKYMDNISERWIPDDVTEHEGAHSKDNYLAYTFFVKNTGDSATSYQTEITIKSVIKNVDEAVRVAVYLNNDKTVYAKKSKITGQMEPNTTPFISNHQVMSETRKDLKSGDVDKYTIVIWLEGDDPECIDDILGGEMKMLMLLTEVNEV